MAAYLRNRRLDRAWGGTHPVLAPGSSVKDFIRSGPSARTRTPSANVKICDHSMSAVRAREEFSSARFLLWVGGRGKVRQMPSWKTVV